MTTAQPAGAPTDPSRRRQLRRLGSGAAVAIATAVPGIRAARAQTYPSRAVHIVVPFPPGGTTDLVSRLVGQELARVWSQPVLVENKPGAGTVIGVDAVAKSAPDGHTLVTVANSFTANQTLVRKLPYDSQRDLRPVALIAYSEHLLAAHPSLPFDNLSGMLAWARAHPGQLSYASFGNGTSAHLSGELLKQSAGIDITHVPYKGQGPALQDLLGGQVSLMFGNLPEFLPYVRSGRLKSLGLAMPRRSPFAGDLATLAEQGLAGIESTSWFGLLAPGRTSDELVARINADVNAVIAGAAMRDNFARASLTALPGSAADFAAFMRTETERYARVIRAAGIRID